MPLQTLIEFPYAIIQLNMEIDTLELIFKRKLVFNQFIETSDAVINEFKKLDVNRFLVDPSNMGVLSPEGQRYVATKSLPEMINHLNGRYLFHAQVLPQKDVFARYASQNIRQKLIQELPHRLTIGQFNTIDEARNWLADKI